jgi:FkbM family methyltransferase
MSVLTDWRGSISRRLREAGLTHYLVADSRFGLDPGLVPHLPQRQPIRLIDVGANRGDFAGVVKAHCGLREALLIEPQPDLAQSLSDRFPEDTVRVVSVGVADSVRTQSFDILEAGSCSSLLPIRAEVAFADLHIDVRVRERREIQVTTLDHVVASHQWTGVTDLLKIDTQGNELKVIEGAERMLQQVRLLWVEVSFRSLYEGDAQFDDVHARLFALGFRLYSLHPGFRGADRELLQADALFLGPSAT